MDDNQRRAFSSLMTVGDDIGRLITHATATQQPLNLPGSVVAKLREAQQAIFAAQRIMLEGE